jgi:hypothetical protein
MGPAFKTIVDDSLNRLRPKTVNKNSHTRHIDAIDYFFMIAD